jgi:heme/copper-type cytochrome/quinol oxidase subunit 4
VRFKALYWQGWQDFAPHKKLGIAMHVRQRYHYSQRRWGLMGAILSLFVIFLIVPVLEKNLAAHIVLQSSFAALVLSTIYAVDRDQWSICVFFFIPYIYFEALSFYVRSLPYLLTGYLFSTIFTALAIYILMRRILYARTIELSLILVALMVYILFGILWANMYFIDNCLSPESFAGVGGIAPTHETFIETNEQYFNLLYYSFATMATLGMGDITPINHLAKSLTALEGMFGQLFVAIIIAKLTSVWSVSPHVKK